MEVIEHYNKLTEEDRERMTKELEKEKLENNGVPLLPKITMRSKLKKEIE